MRFNNFKENAITQKKESISIHKLKKPRDQLLQWKCKQSFYIVLWYFLFGLKRKIQPPQLNDLLIVIYTLEIKRGLRGKKQIKRGKVVCWTKKKKKKKNDLFIFLLELLVSEGIFCEFKLINTVRPEYFVRWFFWIHLQVLSWISDPLIE